MPNVNNVEQSGATEQRNDGWISVEVNEPDAYEMVILFGPMIGVYPGWLDPKESHYCWQFIDDLVKIENGEFSSMIEPNGAPMRYITHWQPLPPPPKTD